jgi:hypothetical protein
LALGEPPSIQLADQLGFLLGDRLGLALILPKLGGDGEALDLVEACGQASGVKDTPAGSSCGAAAC